jgi:hypothetical protein
LNKFWLGNEDKMRVEYTWSLYLFLFLFFKYNIVMINAHIDVYGDILHRQCFIVLYPESI